MENTSAWEDYCNTPDPQNQPLPSPWNKCTGFEVFFDFELVDLITFFTKLQCYPFFSANDGFALHAPGYDGSSSSEFR